MQYYSYGQFLSINVIPGYYNDSVNPAKTDFNGGALLKYETVDDAGVTLDQI